MDSHMNTQSSAGAGHVLRIRLAGSAEKYELLRRMISSSDSMTLASIDSTGVLTAFVATEEAQFALASSVFASGMYPLATEELTLISEGNHHAN